MRFFEVDFNASNVVETLDMVDIISNSVVNVRHKFRLEERDNSNELQLCTRCSAGTSAISSPAAC